jgi:DNA-binding transcriptional MerR regulator
MQNSVPGDRLLSIGKSSEYLGVSIDTLRRWEKRGRITPLRSPGGHRYYSKDELDSLFGKRYTRDEETQRRTNEELGKVDVTPESVNPPPSEVEKPQEETTLTDLTQNLSNLLHPITEELPSPPVIDSVAQLPPWRSAETASQEIPLVSEEQVKPPVEELIPPKEPEIIQKPVVSPPTPEPSYQSILTPAKTEDNTLSEEEIERRIHSIIKTGKGESKSGLVLVVLSTIFAIVDIILVIIWVSSSRIISPIP